MNYLKSKEWWERAGVRAIKTVCQTAVAMIGTSALVSEVTWAQTISAALLAGVVSLLTSLAGLPEVNEESEEEA